MASSWHNRLLSDGPRCGAQVDRSRERWPPVAVELAELIGQLRAELTRAMDAGDGADLRFELGPVELELTVAVNKEAKPGAKVRFWVVELGAEGTVASQAAQRIRLTLDPRRGGAPGRPLISGSEQSGER